MTAAITPGDIFGRLVVVRQTTRWPERWLCRCACSKTRIVRAADLNSGLVDSCGCWGRERWAEWRKKFLPRGYQRDADGGASPTRKSYASMILRCANPSATGYETYGGSGIKVCARWLEEAGFSNFLADMGERPPRTSISRRLDSGNYEPGNCRWDTRSGQRAERMGKRAMIRLHRFHEQQKKSSKGKINGSDDHNTRN